MHQEQLHFEWNAIRKWNQNNKEQNYNFRNIPINARFNLSKLSLTFAAKCRYNIVQINAILMRTSGAEQNALF